MEEENYFKNISIRELKDYTNSNLRESRDKNGNLNFISGNDKLKEIADCEVVNLENENHNSCKIKDLI